jgi:hypothetical protein
MIACRPRLEPLSHALALALAAALVLLAAEAVRAAGGVTIQLTQIKATGRGGPKEIDRALEHLRSQLENFPYKKFDQVGLEARTAADGQTATFGVKGGYTLRAVPAEGGGKSVMLDVGLEDGSGAKKFETKLRIPNGGTVLIAKDFEADDGRIILAITVQRGR